MLDIGCGAAMDLLLAAQRVGPTGHAIGVDMTPSMIEAARASARDAGLTNVEIRQGDAESLPMDDASMDAVMSSGVLNLTTDKGKAFAEIARVLRPGGRLLSFCWGRRSRSSSQAACSRSCSCSGPVPMPRAALC